MGQLNYHIDDDLHRRLKSLAGLNGMTLKELVTGLLEDGAMEWERMQAAEKEEQ